MFLVHPTLTQDNMQQTLSAIQQVLEQLDAACTQTQ